MNNKLIKKVHMNSPVILGFFLLSLLSLILGAATGGRSTAALFSVYRASLLSPLTWLRFFGHVLGHSGLEHFMGNMLLLLVVGPPMEEKYGSTMLLAGIALTALVSGVLHVLLFPSTALLGASGIVFMLILLSSLSGMKSGSVPVTLLLVGVLYLGKELWSMLFVRDSIANLMHIVGGLCGTAFGFWAGGRKRGRRYYGNGGEQGA